MKIKQTITWILTILVSIFFLFSGYMQITSPDTLVIMRSLGYPDYMSMLLGILKLAGAVAILLPCSKTREWAYAGFVFILIGATYSQIASFGFQTGPFIMMLVITAFVLTSWKLRQGNS